jgi:hypothetical protein
MPDKVIVVLWATCVEEFDQYFSFDGTLEEAQAAVAIKNKTRSEGYKYEVMTFEQFFKDLTEFASLTY